MNTTTEQRSVFPSSYILRVATAAPSPPASFQTGGVPSRRLDVHITPTSSSDSDGGSEDDEGGDKDDDADNGAPPQPQHHMRRQQQGSNNNAPTEFQSPGGTPHGITL